MVLPIKIFNKGVADKMKCFHRVIQCQIEELTLQSRQKSIPKVRHFDHHLTVYIPFLVSKHIGIVRTTKNRFLATDPHRLTRTTAYSL